MNNLPIADTIAAYLAPQARHVAIETVAQTGSTNADLMSRIGSLPGPVLRVADTQTAGRGRAGRSWHSAPGASLTFSLAWPFSGGIQALAGLPPAVGVALAEALAEWGVAVKLKWPNDVLRDGAKLAGILIETAPDKSEPKRHWAVIGIGVNVDVPQQLESQIGQPAAGLSDVDGMERNRLLASLLNSLAHTLQQFELQGFAAFVERWNALHAYAGKAVAIVDRDKTISEGTARGVDHAGCLLLDTAQGPVAVTAGDVSLRLTT